MFGEKESGRMKKYIFVKPEELSNKLTTDSPEPDFVEMQIIGLQPGSTIQDALKDLIEINRSQPENNSSNYFSLGLERDKKDRLWHKGNKSKTPLAS
jgi:hypothetical protein